MIVNGDCLEIMGTMEECSIDTIITDPPYGLSFMGKNWDHGVPGVAFWVEASRVAKPGAMLFAFGGTRTVHRLACAIEDAGWIIRDRLAWLYGSGFPKSHNISKAIDKAAGAEREVVGRRTDGRYAYKFEGNGNRPLGSIPEAIAKGGFVTDKAIITAATTAAAIEWDGYGTALKPAQEIIIMAMKPLDGTFAQNAQKWGVAGLWIDGGRVGTDDKLQVSENPTNEKDLMGNMKGKDAKGRKIKFVDAGKGRFPANIIHDGSPEVMAVFPQTKPSKAGIRRNRSGMGIHDSEKGTFGKGDVMGGFNDSGSAARFFYCAKSSKRERNAGLEGMQKKKRDAARNAEQPSMNGGEGNPYNRGANPVINHHPTVKPLALMRYFCRLSRTPSGGVVLDPFAGSGTTGVAAIMEGRSTVLIEKNDEYIPIIKARLRHAQEKFEQEARQAKQMALLSG